MQSRFPSHCHIFVHFFSVQIFTLQPALSELHLLLSHASAFIHFRNNTRVGSFFSVSFLLVCFWSAFTYSSTFWLIIPLLTIHSTVVISFQSSSLLGSIFIVHGTVMEYVNVSYLIFQCQMTAEDASFFMFYLSIQFICAILFLFLFYFAWTVMGSLSGHSGIFIPVDDYTYMYVVLRTCRIDGISFLSLSLCALFYVCVHLFVEYQELELVQPLFLLGSSQVSPLVIYR